MDKRWILILIILIAGCACMYHIVDSSNSVGDAITVVNKTVITLPSGFTIGDDDRSSVTLVNENNNETIFIEDLGKSDTSLDNFKNDLNRFYESNNIHVLNNETLNIKDSPVYRINLKNDTNGVDSTFVYMYSCNHTFNVKFNGYSNEDDLNQDFNFIINTISPDFKQKQD